MKYPIGIQNFAQIREDGYVYVDKTALVYRLVTEGKIYFLSRPRRFGKSLLVDTLACYYEGRKELFEGLAIDSLERDWKHYPVFRMDFNGGVYEKPDSLEKRIDWYLSDWELQYGLNTDNNKKNLDAGERFMEVLRRAHEQTGLRCVVLIDEYDKPILDVLDTDAMALNAVGDRMPVENKHRSTLKALYSTFKAADSDLQFVLLTGVTKFSQVSVFSGFNQLKDISMDARYEALCGITKDELHTVFAGPIEKLAQKYRCSADEMKERLRLRYDGYHFSDEMGDIFNPFSLLNVFDQMKMDDYWFSTGTPTYLIRLLSHSNERINELTGKYYDKSMFIDYKADVERPLPMIYQSGYLTVKDYDIDTERYLLDFPNNEVRKGFLMLVGAGYLNDKGSQRTNSWLGDAALLLMKGRTDDFIEGLTAFLSDIPYDAHESVWQDVKLTEKHFQYTFYLIVRLLGAYGVFIEKRQSKGRVDCILEMKDYVYIFEFKLDGSPEEALRQIEEQGYARPYAADSRKVFKIGVNFSSATRTVDGWAES